MCLLQFVLSLVQFLDFFFSMFPHCLSFRLNDGLPCYLKAMNMSLSLKAVKIEPPVVVIFFLSELTRNVFPSSLVDVGIVLSVLRHVVTFRT